MEEVEFLLRGGGGDLQNLEQDGAHDAVRVGNLGRLTHPESLELV